jgi:hypothetical protein
VRTKKGYAGKTLRPLAIVASVTMLLLVFASTAMASTAQWQGNGYPSQSCTATTEGNMLWIWTGDDPSSLTINGHTYTGWAQQGNGAFHLTLDITSDNYPPTSASVEYTGDAGTLTLSGCNEGGTSTPTPTPTPTASPTATPTASPTPEHSEQGSTATPTPTPTTEGSVKGGTGTPAPSQPDTAIAFGQGPSPVPTIAFAFILLAALGTLAWANVKSARNRS